MNLEKKLKKISTPHLQGSAKTIKDFYNKFIEPYLPDIEQTKKWHKILTEYVKKPDAVLGFRAGNTAGKLRRGWKTVITNDTYSFFYTDNFFAHYFYKLACDTDYEVATDDFYNLMKEKKFPVRFKFRMGREECRGASFDVNGKNPEIGKSGFKLAHVVDAGQNYTVNGINCGMAEIIDKYFPLGEKEDWDKRKHYRELQIKEEDKTTARKLAEMSFLRMVHPMNYFLSPKAPNGGKVYNYYKLNDSNVYEYDIGEDERLISYVRQRFSKKYGKVYKEFLNLVGSEPDNIKENGETTINIKYSLFPLEPKMTEEQNNFFDFLETKDPKYAKQLVVYWSKKLKKDTNIDIYTIIGIDEAEEKYNLFEKGSKKAGTVDGCFYNYSKNANSFPKRLMRRYVEYLKYKQKTNATKYDVLECDLNQ